MELRTLLRSLPSVPEMKIERNLTSVVQSDPVKLPRQPTMRSNFERDGFILLPTPFLNARFLAQVLPVSCTNYAQVFTCRRKIIEKILLIPCLMSKLCDYDFRCCDREIFITCPASQLDRFAMQS